MFLTKSVDINIAGIKAILVRPPRSFMCSVRPVIRLAGKVVPGIISPKMNCIKAPIPDMAADVIQKIIEVRTCSLFCNITMPIQNQTAIKYRYFTRASIEIDGLTVKLDDIIPDIVKRSNPHIIVRGNLISRFFLRRLSDAVRRNAIRKNQSDIVYARNGLNTVWPMVSNPR
jgi:hypothetical protein